MAERRWFAEQSLQVKKASPVRGSEGGFRRRREGHANGKVRDEGETLTGWRGRAGCGRGWEFGKQ